MYSAAVDNDPVVLAHGRPATALTEQLVPGGYLALSHGTFDGPPRRGRQGHGFDLVDPGLVGTNHWRSDDAERGRPGGEWMLAGVGRKRYPVG